MNKTDLRSIIAKLHELEQVPVEPVTEAIPNPFGFFKGLGAGGAKNAIPKPRIDPTGVARGAEDLVAAATSTANKKLSDIRKVTPAEMVAAREEGITINELLMRKYPDTFAKLEKNPELQAKVATEFSKASDEIIVAVERGEDPRALWPKEASMFDKDGRKSLAMSAMGHALLVLGLIVANKNTSSSSSSSSSSSNVNSIPADEIPWSTYLGMDPRKGDSLKRSNNPSSPWVIVAPSGVVVGKIDDPKLVQEIEQLAKMDPEKRKEMAKAENTPTYNNVEMWPAGSLPNPNNTPELPPVGSKVPNNTTPDITTKPDIVIGKDDAKKKKKSKDEKVLPPSKW